jgi:3-methylcrotonyl-CoA carboxylase alpha subunit
MNGSLRRRLDYADEQNTYALTVEYRGQEWLLSHGQACEAMRIVGHEAGELAIKLGGKATHGAVVRDGDVFHVFCGGAHVVLNYNDPLAHAGEAEAEGGRLTAPMPGKVVAVLAEKGKQVRKGTPLLIMEAMKMEHAITAPADGAVEEVLYAVGDQVAEGAQLLSFRTE